MRGRFIDSSIRGTDTDQPTKRNQHNGMTSTESRWETDAKINEECPIPGARWVRVIAHIRKNSTGEVRRHKCSEILHDDESAPSDFNWSENNFSCDCNRELFFEIGNDFDKEECSDGRFSVNLENPVTGEIYYREFAS